jgi:ubiquitin C-terminal hydrolase
MDPSPPVGLRGLGNVGNTCFMNVVVRLLLSSPDFEQMVAATPHLPNCARRRRGRRRSAGEAAPECLMCQLELLRAAMRSSEEPITPHGILCQRLAIGRSFIAGAQADAVEFYQALVDKLQACLPVSASIQLPSDPRPTPICQGIVQSVVTCLECGTTTTKPQHCMNIELKVGGVISLR